MKVDAYIDNPVISNQQEYYELLERLKDRSGLQTSTTSAGGCKFIKEYNLQDIQIPP